MFEYYQVDHCFFCMSVPVGLTWSGYFILTLLVIGFSCIIIELSHRSLKHVLKTDQQEYIPEIQYKSNNNQNYLGQSTLWRILKKNKLKYLFIYILLVTFIITRYSEIL